jgi:glycosyltransferase involved in cell wall biosynthesis
MMFSIVVPTYNEENDIVGTLDALVALDYPDKEIIVVDDSTDSTPDIVRRYAAKGVRLVRPARREGRCGARNIGIMESIGDIVVILNADVRPKKDFLRLLSPYYEQGYDYVLVNSEVANTNDLFARYVDAMSAVDETSDPSWMEWTEGFSCRRDVAIKAGMFPTGFAVPICAGEDGFFGANLKNLGARKKVDFSITVDHIAPASLSEYWQIRIGRGRGSPQIRHFLQRWPMGMIAAWASLRIAKTLAYIVMVVPVMYVVWRASRYSSKGIRDVPPFLGAWLIEQVAFHVGEWGSIFEIARARRTVTNVRAGRT